MRDRLEQVQARGFGLFEHVGRDVDDLELRAFGVVVERPHQRLHLDEVDDAAEVALGADRQLHDGGYRVEAVSDHLDAAPEVGADAVHLVDEAEARHVVLVRLAPHRLGLRLDTGDRVEHRDRAVEDAQRPLDLDREVDVAGRVDDVDLAVAPLRGGRGRGDRDAALLLLDHVVHDRGAFVDLTDLVGPAGVVEDALGRRGLARVDVGHDPDVAGLLEREFACHCVGCFLVRGASSKRPGAGPGRRRGSNPLGVSSRSAFRRPPCHCSNHHVQFGPPGGFRSVLHPRATSGSARRPCSTRPSSGGPHGA